MPCGAGRQRERGPSTGMEEEIEDSGGSGGVREGERRYSCGHLVGFLRASPRVFRHVQRSRGWVGFFFCPCLFAKTRRFNLTCDILCGFMFNNK